MNKETLLEIIHDNPESTILIHYFDSNKVVRIDVDEYDNFNLETGEGLTEVGISGEEKERRKRRKDLKMKLTGDGADDIREIYTISRINEQQDDDIDTGYVQKQQRNRRSPGSETNRRRGD